MHACKFLMTVCALAGLILSGKNLDFDGDFSTFDKAGNSATWLVHPWHGYQPSPKLTLRKGDHGQPNVLSVRQIAAPLGTEIITHRRQVAHSGDRLTISFQLRGKGKATFRINNFTASGGWNRPSEWHQDMELSPSWQTYLYEMTIENGPLGETGLISPCFWLNQGAQADIRGLRISHAEGKYRGEQNIPYQWLVFGPMEAGFVPSREQLASLPDTLNGVKARPGYCEQGKLDFAPFIGGKGARKCGWAFGNLQSKIDCDYTFGVGGDWWMQVFVNGEKITDTMALGNQLAPVAMDNYVKTVRLKKGDNIIAVKLISGNASSLLHIGGPRDLNRQVSNLVLNKITWIENFDGERLQCSGQPTLIQGNPTPGLLSTTGQAVFTTASSLTIQPRDSRLPVPAQDHQFTAQGIRIQNFGREQRRDAHLDMITSGKEGTFVARISHRRQRNQLTVTFLDNGKTIATHPVPYAVLPADFLFSFNAEGQFALTVNSLADSSSRTFPGKSKTFLRMEQAQGRLCLTADGDQMPAEAVVDNYLFGVTASESKTVNVPFVIDREKTFDPVKKGWPLVFADEFNGSELDLSKWFHGYASHPENVTVRDGKLIITATLNKQGKTQSASLTSLQEFLFGYFEARVRFRKESGWWAAFWLYPPFTPCNPYIDGLEVDIFEDYYLRARTKGGKPGNILDHNYHAYLGNNVLKSWNYASVLPGSIQDFYVIGCKWTPFELSYYLNGKLISSTASHSPYDSVTFDAFHHISCVAPLRTIVSAPCGRSGGDPKLGNFPEEYQVDYVRVYACPRPDLPEVRMTASHPDRSMVKLGTSLSFRAEVKAAAGTNSPIKAVYLMDSGHLLDYRTEPPYDFTVPLTKEYYDTTRYVKGGRSGKMSELDANLHAYTIFVQDADGKVAFAPPVTYLLSTGKKSTPYQGKPQVIPGALRLSHYDEGGPRVAYHDSTAKNVADRTGTFRPGEAVDARENILASVASGEWLNLTVMVKRGGSYRASLRYGTPLLVPRHGVWLLVDGKYAGKFKLETHGQRNFAIDSTSVLRHLRLSEGEHVLTFIFFTGANYGELDFTLEE